MRPVSKRCRGTWRQSSRIVRQISRIPPRRGQISLGLPIFIRERLGLPELAKLPGLSAALLGGGFGSSGGDAAILRDWPLRAHGAQTSDSFASPRHRARRLPRSLHWPPPSDAPAVFSLLQAIELAPTGDQESDSGVFYPWEAGAACARCAARRVRERAGVRILLEHAGNRGGGWGESDEVTAEGKTAAATVHGVRIAPCEAGADAVADAVAQIAFGPAAASAASSSSSAGTSASDVAAGLGSGCSEVLRCDAVIVNADLAAAGADAAAKGVPTLEYAECSELAGHDVMDRLSDVMAGDEELLRVDGWRYSSSTVSFYWSTEARYAELRHHNVFLAGAEARRDLFDATSYAQWDARIGSSPFHFYVHCPARTDPSVVELDTDDAIMVLVPVPPLDERLSLEEAEAATDRMVNAARQAVIRRFEAAGMDGFGASIVDERVRTPLGWREAFGLRRGSVFGLAHNLEQLAIARPGRRHPSVDGLHWVGANTRPGNGVPLVLIGAMKTSEEALADLKRKPQSGVAAGALMTLTRSPR